MNFEIKLSKFANAACSGFVYGVATAEQFIRSGHTQTALVIGAEVLHPFMNWNDSHGIG